MNLDIDITMEYNISLIPNLDENVPVKVCFVCTGNTCRSPMAAAVLNKLGKRYGMAAISAGLFAEDGAPITENAAIALADYGFEVPDHSARKIDKQIVMECDRVIGITINHEFLLTQMFPFAAEKIFAMPEDIDDPWGGSIESYETCLLQIIKGVREMFKLYD
ncbi:MAG: hypothetical protein FWF15_00990 [Oscillospiraceae bacterium]|nr:hypothetical protein [Oscillospiraceae bacterium]